MHIYLFQAKEKPEMSSKEDRGRSFSQLKKLAREFDRDLRELKRDVENQESRPLTSRTKKKLNDVKTDIDDTRVWWALQNKSKLLFPPPFAKGEDIKVVGYT